MTKKEYQKWIKRLKKYWKMMEKEYERFLMKEKQIEELMEKETGEQLEFFYVDGMAVGIGHKDWGRHNRKHPKYFPLIHDSDLSK